MKNFIKKFWFPLIIILFVAAQGFGKNIAQYIYNISAWQTADTVVYNNSGIYTKYRHIKDTSIYKSNKYKIDTTNKTTIIAKNDTIKAPEELRLSDPFRFRFYAALVDSVSRAFTRDSLKTAKDSITLHKLDSIIKIDSIATAKKKFQEWYNNLSKQERKKYDLNVKFKEKQKQIDSLLKMKEEKKAIKDSIIKHTPRILETFAIPDSMQYKRIISWKANPYFANINLYKIDTSYNYHFYEYPFYKNDINATYLGVSGSAAQYFDYFKRTNNENISFYRPYEMYSFSPSTLPMYNTKTPYTELAYSGTLFTNTQIEEANIHILTSQNILPSFNFTILYDRYGGNGLLQNESTDNRTFASYGNYLGKKYLAHFGYIYNKADRKDNGGMVSETWIRDTTVGPREIPVNLSSAKSLIKKHIFFINQTYRIPFSFLKKSQEQKDLKIAKKQEQDILATKDSAKIQKHKETIKELEQKINENKGKLDKDVTTAFIGQSTELSFYRRLYTDQISENDKQGASFYNNKFFINPYSSYDSIRVMKLENRVFIKLQPWEDDAIVSSINAGIGNRIESFYLFNNLSYLTKTKNTAWNSTYVYGGAKGKLKKYFNWEADGYYTFLGTKINDLGLNANMQMNLYPFRKYKNSPIEIFANFSTILQEPTFYEQNYFSNHYKWTNNFNKISTTKVEGNINIPHWNFSVNAGWAILKNQIYYDKQGIIRQSTTPLSIAKIGLQKNFKLSVFHFDNQILAQATSNDNVVPLPLFSANLKWYMQFNIYKPGTKQRAMQMQIGVNGHYNSKFYLQGYNPAIGQFVNQRQLKYGNNPYFDLFINMQWKRACIFVKYVNAGNGWPNDKPNYFSAAGYIRPQTTIRMGIFWPFYLQPNKNVRMSSNAGTSIGGGTGLGGGLSGSIGNINSVLQH